MLISIPTAIGEIVDKTTILRIKSKKITDVLKLNNITKELELLNGILSEFKETITDKQKGELFKIEKDLENINFKIWEVEDDIRSCEMRQSFGYDFIKLARNVYHFNDERARLKRQINELVGSAIVEEKSYQDYQRTNARRSTIAPA